MKKQVKIIKDESPVIYKEDIMNEDGKLNTIGAFLVIGVCLIALNIAFKYLSENIVSKKDVN